MTSPQPFTEGHFCQEACTADAASATGAQISTALSEVEIDTALRDMSKAVFLHSVTFRRKSVFSLHFRWELSRTRDGLCSHAVAHLQGVVLGPENHTKTGLPPQLDYPRLLDRQVHLPIHVAKKDTEAIVTRLDAPKLQK